MWQYVRFEGDVRRGDATHTYNIPSYLTIPEFGGMFERRCHPHLQEEDVCALNVTEGFGVMNLAVTAVLIELRESKQLAANLDKAKCSRMDKVKW